MMEATDLAPLRLVLEDELAAIDRQLSDYGALSASDSPSLPMDEGFADSGQATAERSEILGLIEQLHATRHEVVAALRRMDEGTYGACERCGGAIPPQRLEALPTTRLCLSCKQAR